MVRPTKSCVGLFVLTVSLYSSVGMAAEAGPDPQASQSPFQDLGLRVMLPSTSNEQLKSPEKADVTHCPHSLVSSPTGKATPLVESLVVHSPRGTNLCLEADVAASMLAALNAALPGASSSSAASAAPPEVDDKEAQCCEGIETLFFTPDEDNPDDAGLF